MSETALTSAPPSSAVYFVRYGVVGNVARFLSACPKHKRGDLVIVQTPRGTECGEVLVHEEGADFHDFVSLPKILRPADEDDARRIEDLRALRPRLLAQCNAVFQELARPIVLLDVEPLLEPRRVVVHYLAASHIDTSAHRAELHARFQFDVRFEPACDADRDDADPSGSGCGSSGGCGNCQGNGSAERDRHARACSSCAVASLVRRFHAVT